MKIESHRFVSRRNRMQLNANQAFYLLVNNKSIASMSTSMAEIYRDDKVTKTKLRFSFFIFDDFHFRQG